MNLIVGYDQGVAFRYFFPEATNGLFLLLLGEHYSSPCLENIGLLRTLGAGSYNSALEDWKDESERLT